MRDKWHAGRHLWADEYGTVDASELVDEMFKIRARQKTARMHDPECVLQQVLDAKRDIENSGLAFIDTEIGGKSYGLYPRKLLGRTIHEAFCDCWLTKEFSDEE